MFELKVITDFAAAHQLRNFRGNCEKLHGHNWKVEVILSGDKLNEAGLLIDFREVKEAANRILKELDHSFLNDLPQFRNENPSSENIAAYLFETLSGELNDNHLRVIKVTAWESDSACASFIGSP
jgi:6-pyruvoyltetrahydropterin/6-carboxytetrahydropterin synthase